MRRFWAGALLCVCVAALALPAFFVPGQASAQSPTSTATYDWAYDFDFTTGMHGWSIWGACAPYGQYIGGTGFQSVYLECASGSRVYAQLVWPQQAHVVRIRIVYDIASGVQSANDIFRAWDGDFVNSGTLQCTTTGETGTGEHDQTISVDCPLARSWLFAVGGRDYNGNDVITLQRITVYGVNAAPITLTPSSTPTPTMTPTVTPVPTQPPTGACQSSWTKTFNFGNTADAQNWASVQGYTAARDETGFHTMPNNTDNGWMQMLYIWTNLGGEDPAQTVIGSVSLDITYNSGSPGTMDDRKIQVLTDSANIIDERHPASGHRAITQSTNAQGGRWSIWVNASGGTVNQGDANGDATVNSITFTGVGYGWDGSCNSSAPSPDANSWAYPVAQEQQRINGLRSLSENGIQDPTCQIGNCRAFLRSPFGYLTSGTSGSYDHDKASIVVYSNVPGIYVHSMTDGTVASVTRLDASPDCRNTNPWQLVAAMPDYSCFFDEYPAEGLNYHGASLVIVQTTTALISYAVSDVQATQGETVSKGCILGKTLSFKTSGDGVAISWPPALGFTWNDSPDGYTIVQARDLQGIPFDIIPYLRDPPSDITCDGSGGGGAPGGCTLVRDASFSLSGDAAWMTQGDAPAHAPGETMGLWLKQETHQYLSIAAGNSYGITISTHLLEAGTAIDSFTVTLGAGDPHSFTVAGVTQQTFTVDPATILALNNAMPLSIKPTDGVGQNIVVDYICVTDADSGPAAPAGGCLLLNPDFDTQTDWTLGAGAAWRDDAPGLVSMPNNGTVSQSLRLFPKSNGTQTYRITVEASVGHAPGLNQDFNLTWSWGSDGSTMGPWTDNAFLSDTDTFTVSTESTHALTLTSTVIGSTSPGFLSRVCIETDDGSNPPGYQPPGPPGLSPNCKICSYVPVGDVNYDLPGVIAWLMCGISQIWHCQMKTILFGIWQVSTNILAFMAMLRLWLSGCLMALVNWGNGNLQVMARWLNGWLSNLGQMLFSGPRSVIQSDTGSNLWDVLRSLFNNIGSVVSNLTGALTALFNDLKEVLITFLGGLFTLLRVLFEIVGAIVGLIVTVVFRIVMGILGLLQQFVNLIISAINAPPVVPAGVPVCDDSSEMIAENCVAIFMIDQTVLGDQSPLWQLLPLLQGAAGFGLIWWAVQKFRNLLAGMGDG